MEDTSPVGFLMPKLLISRSDGKNDERPCRNCGCNCTELGGWYHELGEYGVDEYHCSECHSELYPDDEVWAELCEEDSDEFYWTEKQLKIRGYEKVLQHSSC